MISTLAQHVSERDPRIERTRAKVLAAARALLVAEGLDAITHLRVAEAAGVGRRTTYRHWPTTTALLHDVLDAAAYPVGARTGDLRTDLVAHLEALRAALVDGPLRYVMLALNERAVVRPELRALRDELTEAGCARVRALVAEAVSDGRLVAALDLDAAAAALEGPIVYRALVRAERVPPSAVTPVVDAFLATATPPG
jgi:AcrR family transcriptional regulator